MSGPVRVTPDFLRTIPLPVHEAGDDKEGRGRVLVIGGSVEVPGGALLAGVGALRAGAGKLQIATVRSVAPGMALAVPEALVMGLPETPAGGIDPSAADALTARASKCGAVLLGPGMDDKPAVQALTDALLAAEPGPAWVIDAAAMMHLGERADLLRRHAGRIIITPHPGEMAGLLGIPKDQVEADPFGTARHVAERLGVVVALKGGRTEIAAPDGTARTFDGDTIGLATSGSGDTLAGVIVGLLARGASPVDAATWGVYLHGEAGTRLMRRHGLGFLARELLAEVPAIMRELAESVAGG